MPAIARLVKRAFERMQGFSIHHNGVFVANVAVVDGLDTELAATEAAGGDPWVYVPGLHIAGLATPDASSWFAAWRGMVTKRDLAIRDHERERTVLITGTFVTAWSDGSWYDLALETAVIEVDAI